MADFFNWLAVEWQLWVIPTAVFVFCLIGLLWLRRIIALRIEKWINNRNLPAEATIIKGLRWPTIIWCVIISIILAVAVSSATVIPPDWKSPIEKGLWTLFSFSIILALINLVRKAIVHYGPRMQMSRRGMVTARNISIIALLVIGVLITLEIWGAPVGTFILLIVIVLIAVALLLRDIAPNLSAGFHLNSAREMKEGDYIKLGTGEKGRVTKTGPLHVHLQTSNGSNLLIPNRKILQTTIVNYGRQIKKAREPFLFRSHLLLPELTGLKARNIGELVEILKIAPDAVIYYHTHHFLEQHFYLAPEPVNDFSIWVNDSLGDESLGERLGSVDTMAYSSIEAIRERLVGIIEEYLTRNNITRQVYAGDEFHFMKSVSAVFPTKYIAHDLSEFVEALAQVSLGSLYFHMFEARLWLGRRQNDFSTWLVNNMDEPELAADIARIDPYTYTLEGLRLTLVHTVEKHLK